MRARLDERLKLFVLYMRTRQFDNCYDLFSDSYIEEMKTVNIRSKSDYLARLKQLPESDPAFDDFLPLSTTKTANDSYLISGTVVSRHNNQTFETKSSLEARWQKEDWYFSEFTLDERR